MAANPSTSSVTPPPATPTTTDPAANQQAIMQMIASFLQNSQGSLQQAPQTTTSGSTATAPTSIPAQNPNMAYSVGDAATNQFPLRQNPQAFTTAGANGSSNPASFGGASPNFADTGSAQSQIPSGDQGSGIGTLLSLFLQGGGGQGGNPNALLGGVKGMPLTNTGQPLSSFAKIDNVNQFLGSNNLATRGSVGGMIANALNSLQLGGSTTTDPKANSTLVAAPAAANAVPPTAQIFTPYTPIAAQQYPSAPAPAAAVAPPGAVPALRQYTAQ